MGICYFCGKEVLLPFRCKYCNLTFCDEHRLPEKHNCTGLPERGWGDKAPTEKPKKIPVPQEEEGSSKTTINSKRTQEKVPDIKPIKTPSQKLSNRIKLFAQSLSKYKKINVKTIFNIGFLLIISLPVLDSVQLMWDSPLSFSRTFLPKWWNLFPSEYPTPSINLLYVYIGMLGLYVYVIWKFLSRIMYSSYDPRRLKIRQYYYVILVGTIFLYFFSEANFFLIHSVQKIISNFTGG